MGLTAFVWGAGVGLGLWLCGLAVMSRADPIPQLMARPNRSTRTPETLQGLGGRNIQQRVEVTATRLFDRLGLVAGDAGSLDLVGRSQGRHIVDKVVIAFTGFAGIVLAGFALDTTGVGIAPALLLLIAAVGAAAGFVYPDLALRDDVRRRRGAFRHALSAYLDLVNILLAGGAGVETALFAAADAGDGWAFGRLRSALDRSRRIGVSPWDALSDLGRWLEVNELTELAASVALAGSHGARIRASLAAKADALRGHQLAETEAAAESATERMTIPLSVLLFGFLVLIAYPAITQISGG